MARKQERKAGANLIEDSYKGFDPLLGEFTLTEEADGSMIFLTTARGSYPIPRHHSINAYIGVALRTKVRITVKKEGIAWLTYWY
jgi:hypothetical protein